MDYAKLIGQAIYYLAMLAIPALGAYALSEYRKHAKSGIVIVGTEIARIAVQATEQMSRNGALSGMQKYGLALTQARAFADRLGIEFSDQEWQSLIERAVNEISAVAGQINATPLTPLTQAISAAPVFVGPAPNPAPILPAQNVQIASIPATAPPGAPQAAQ